MENKGEIREEQHSFYDGIREDYKIFWEGVDITIAVNTLKSNLPPERFEKISRIIDRWESLIWTEYNLGWTLWKGRQKGIDCSHFVAYSLWLPQWEKENTWSLDKKYWKNEVKIEDAMPGDLLMWPWHYDEDVGRKIWHVEIVIGKTADAKIITLWASGLSRKWDKYSQDGSKLSQYNCVGFAVREVENWMKILRV